MAKSTLVWSSVLAVSIIMTCLMVTCECLFPNSKPKIGSSTQITSPKTPSTLIPDERVLVSQAHMQLTFDLMSSMIMAEAYNLKTKLLDSLVFSPLSIQSILMMIHLGAKGKTKADLARMMHFDDFVNSSTTFARTHQIFGESVKSLLEDEEISKYLAMANQIFVNKDLSVSHNYKVALKHYHQTTLRPIDFTSNVVIDKINDWVAKTTKGSIKNFLTGPLSPMTALIALNALHFKGDWLYRFDEKETQKNSWFQLTNGQSVQVNMMVGKFPIAYGEINERGFSASIVELPYRTQRLGLFLILPLENKPNSLFNLIRSLNSTSFTQLITSMKKSKPGDEVNIRVPKFEMQSKPDLTSILRYHMGLKSLFTGSMSDFSAMLEPKPTSPPVSLSQFSHQAVLSINENGSIASAATATVVERVGTFTGPYFECDRPFLFFLTDKQTGLILFAGIFGKP